MSLASVSEFLLMGGYAAYVWSAYGLTITLMIVMSLLALFKSSRTWKKLKFTQDLKTKKEIEP
ncbi:MAG: heme exporter protein CcmD [Gammaproteobacteria bacterium]|jgi:heme exporter protein D|nr:heme exporter protein CcmD [Gammaproteobacteria bacterium]MBT5202873.1 heme exporter protein CcmD [Gammaproteobacteria bacterium]MBT5601740.1 heme exporter protein CcmD [Gammaproteobacteria bacterium]MBT6245089.1 heme exporter protein CcmD [Gammaproteobacteria bacterium]